MPAPLRLPNASEQEVLDHLHVRLVTEGERAYWNAEVSAHHHYLYNATLVGEQLGCVAESQGHWLARPGWSAPARHLHPREAWIGWSMDQLAARRHSLATTTPAAASWPTATNCPRWPAAPWPFASTSCRPTGRPLGPSYRRGGEFC